MGKTFRYEIPRLPEEVFNITTNFWNTGHGTIWAMNYNPDEQFSIIEIERGMNMKFWYGSYGERYRFLIYNQPTENKGTIVDVTINLKFGFGLQWNVPNKILTNWAQYIGTNPIDFSKKVWPFYLVIFSLIMPLFVMMIILMLM